MVFEAVVDGTDFQLVAMAKSGSNEAFETLMNAHMDKVYGVALRIVQDPDVAEDVTQDVFITVFKQLNSFRGDSAFSTWLYRITVNRALRTIKKESRYLTDGIQELIDSQVDSTADPERMAITIQNRKRIYNLMNKLPKKQRAVLALRIEKELSFKEIAKIMGRTIGGVKANYFHAVKNLKAAWKQTGGGK